MSFTGKACSRCKIDASLLQQAPMVISAHRGFFCQQGGSKLKSGSQERQEKKEYNQDEKSNGLTGSELFRQFRGGLNDRPGYLR
mgnify:CR=1 FL=1